MLIAQASRMWQKESRPLSRAALGDVLLLIS
jgi:hypothetical protein